MKRGPNHPLTEETDMKNINLKQLIAARRLAKFSSR